MAAAGMPDSTWKGLSLVDQIVVPDMLDPPAKSAKTSPLSRVKVWTAPG